MADMFYLPVFQFITYPRISFRRIVRLPLAA